MVKARQLVGERKEKVRPVQSCGRGDDGKQRARNVYRIQADHAKWAPDMGRIAMIRFRLLARESWLMMLVHNERTSDRQRPRFGGMKAAWRRCNFRMSKRRSPTHPQTQKAVPTRVAHPALLRIHIRVG